MRLVFALLGPALPVALGAVPSCAIAGQGLEAIAGRYDDPVVTSANGGTGIEDALTCQALCAARLSCSVFTYYSADGGCWLQGSGLRPKPMPGATAGPRSCPESTFPEANEASEAEANGDSIVITAAPMAPIDVTTPKPSRFIKAGDQLYFAEGNNPRRIHLVRFHCTGCEEACQTYITVNPDYVASLQQDLDFTCAMLVSTTTVEPGEFQVSSVSSSPWWWPLLLCLLLCCCLAGFLIFDEDWQRRAKGMVKNSSSSGKAERQPLTGSHGTEGSELSALPASVLGPGPPVSGTTYTVKEHQPRLFAA
ncbi:unnamed protein product [Durusdinium trenchii]|uniref:Apple domain-containing protein n=1 Tax=Durusdinium trenchii TaxID=1381693 RepID=A0ABP0KKZ0_9DINO